MEFTLNASDKLKQYAEIFWEAYSTAQKFMTHSTDIDVELDLLADRDGTRFKIGTSLDSMELLLERVVQEFVDHCSDEAQCHVLLNSLNRCLVTVDTRLSTLRSSIPDRELLESDDRTAKMCEDADAKTKLQMML